MAGPEYPLGAVCGRCGAPYGAHAMGTNHYPLSKGTGAWDKFVFVPEDKRMYLFNEGEDGR